MMLIAGPGWLPDPARNYFFLPLRVQKKSAVRRPAKASRSLISIRTIADPPFCSREGPGLPRAFPYEAQTLRPETAHSAKKNRKLY
jgi:hypothetical protein